MSQRCKRTNSPFPDSHIVTSSWKLIFSPALKLVGVAIGDLLLVNDPRSCVSLTGVCRTWRSFVLLHIRAYQSIRSITLLHMLDCERPLLSKIMLHLLDGSAICSMRVKTDLFHYSGPECVWDCLINPENKYESILAGFRFMFDLWHTELYETKSPEHSWLWCQFCETCRVPTHMLADGVRICRECASFWPCSAERGCLCRALALPCAMCPPDRIVPTLTRLQCSICRAVVDCNTEYADDDDDDVVIFQVECDDGGKRQYCRHCLSARSLLLGVKLAMEHKWPWCTDENAWRHDGPSVNLRPTVTMECASSFLDYWGGETERPRVAFASLYWASQCLSGKIGENVEVRIFADATSFISSNNRNKENQNADQDLE
jgi:hypothetical protein